MGWAVLIPPEKYNEIFWKNKTSGAKGGGG